MQTITPASIQYINQVLGNPYSIMDADMESINSLKENFPYFVPAHYLESAFTHKRQPFAPAMLAKMQLYQGNWLLLCHFLRDAIGNDHPVSDQELNNIISAELNEPFKLSDFEDDNEVNYDEGINEEELEAIFALNNIPVVNNEPVLNNTDDTDEEEKIETENDETLILPVYTEDYFFHQGMQVSNDIPEQREPLKNIETDTEEDKSLMVVMSFSEWLMHYKHTTEKEKEEEEDKKALRTMWQKEKLAAALEEEDDEIPENVFEMAVNSITQEEDLASEPLAEIYIKQQKFDKAIEMYRKLSLRNPQKNAYFARKIDEIKEKRL